MMKPFLFFISVFFLIGCASQQERTDKFLKANPEYFAEKCAINFPIQETIIEGETKTDSIRIPVPGIKIPCPEYIDQKGQLQKPTVQCPDTEKLILLKQRTDKIIQESTANIIRLKTENSELVIRNNLLQEQNSNLKKDHAQEIAEQKSKTKRCTIISAVAFLLLTLSIYLHFKR